MRMTSRQWIILAGVFAGLTATGAALLLARGVWRPGPHGAPCPPIARDTTPCCGRDMLQQIVADPDLDMATYWSALDVASVHMLRGASASRPEDVEQLLATLPSPERIRLSVVAISGTGRYLLIGSSDPQRASDGGYLSVLRNDSRWGWEMCGSMQIPAGSRFWGVWLDASGKWLAIASADVGGTRSYDLRVQTMDTEGPEGSCGDWPIFDFVNGSPEITPNGILVEHAAPWAANYGGADRGSRSLPHVLPTSGFGPDPDRPEIYSLVRLDSPRQVFPKP